MKLIAALLLLAGGLSAQQNLGAKVGRVYRYDAPEEKPSVTHQIIWRTSQVSMVTGIAINAVNAPKIDKTFAIRSGVAVGFLFLQEWHTRRKAAKEAKERMMTLYSASNAVIGTTFGVTGSNK